MTWPQLNTTSADNNTSLEIRKCVSNALLLHWSVLSVYYDYSFANFCFTYSPEVLIIWTDGVLLQPLDFHWSAHVTQWFYSCTSCRFKYYKHKAMFNLEDRRKPFQIFPGWNQVTFTRVWSSASNIFSILPVEFAVVEWIPIFFFSDISKNRLLRAIG